jgi:cell division protein FtsB
VSGEAAELERLVRENAYLKARNAQLQDEVTGLGAEAARLQQIVERLHGRRPDITPPNPLSSGQ